LTIAEAFPRLAVAPSTTALSPSFAWRHCSAWISLVSVLVATRKLRFSTSSRSLVAQVGDFARRAPAETRPTEHRQDEQSAHAEHEGRGRTPTRR
jgi:hypothetical protein